MQFPYQSKWTSDEDEILRDSAARGLSMAQTARKLVGRSRNSVAGRAFRLGVCFPMTQKKYADMLDGVFCGG